MKQLRILLLPALEGGCSCGSTCGEGARTDNRQATALMERLARELGDSVEVNVASYLTREGMRSAAAALDSAVRSARRLRATISEDTLPGVLAAAGPFLIVNGKVVANGTLPTLDELKTMVALESSVDALAPS